MDELDWSVLEASGQISCMFKTEKGPCNEPARFRVIYAKSVVFCPACAVLEDGAVESIPGGPKDFDETEVLSARERRMLR